MYSSFARLVALSTVLTASSAFAAEPIVVLTSPSHNVGSAATGNNKFARDPDYSAKHKVKTNETLSKIIAQYYGASGLNKRFLELAIVSRNSHAFVRGNPHFLYAGRTLHLPSVNEIHAMIVGKSAHGSQNAASGRSGHIYFNGF